MYLEHEGLEHFQHSYLDLACSARTLQPTRQLQPMITTETWSGLQASADFTSDTSKTAST